MTRYSRGVAILLTGILMLSMSALTGCSHQRTVVLQGNTIQSISSSESVTVQGPAYCLGPETLAKLLEKAEACDGKK